TKTETRSARCRLTSVLAGSRALPGDLVTYERTVRHSGFTAAPASVGGPAGQNTKCAAGHCLSQWAATRILAVDRSRPTRDCVFAIVAACRLSAAWVSGGVCQIPDGDRKTKSAGRAVSQCASRGKVVDDSSRGGTGHGVSDRSVSG